MCILSSLSRAFRKKKRNTYIVFVHSHCFDRFLVSVTLLSVSKEAEGARWVDANLRARKSIERRRHINMLERRSVDELDMSVDELLQLTEGKFYSGIFNFDLCVFI